MIQILYTRDHEARGRALSEVEAGSKHCTIDTVASKKEGLDTLVFWGHGDQYSFCHKRAAELVTIITNWKNLNDKLSTVELITCNARHYTGNSDSYANQIKTGLRAGFFRNTRNIVVKALPTTRSGALNAFSILLAEPNTKSWCYVTGPGTDDKIMFQGANLITSHIVDGKKVSFKGDIAQRADEITRANLEREWTMNYGYFNTLRKNLVAV